MSYRTLYYALVIPGIGTPFNLLEPYAFYEGDNTLGGGVTSYSNVQALLSTPETLGTKIQPLTGTVDSGSITFEMIAPGAGVEVSNVPAAPNLDIAALFTRRILEFDGILAADISSVDTTIELFSFTGLLFDTGDLLYLENETIQLGAFSPPVVNNVQTFTGCSRGVFGSRATTHLSKTTGADPLDPFAGYDNRVYFNPKIIGREVFVLEHDGTTLNTVFRGVLTNVEMSRDMSALKVHLQDLFSLFATRVFNKNAYGPEQDTQSKDVQVTVGDINTTSFQIQQTSSVFTNNYGPGSRPSGFPTFYTYALLQIGDSLVPGIWFRDPASPEYEIPKYYGFADEQLFVPPFRVRYPPLSVLPALIRPRSKNILDSPAFEETGVFTEPIFEVLSVGRSVVDEDGLEVASLNPINVLNPYHPLTSWLALTCSVGRRSSATSYGATNGTYDLWRYQWGMGVPQDLVDIAGIEALIADTSDQVVQNAVVFGWGGDTWRASDFREKLLTPFFFYPHLTSDYKLTVSQLSVVLPSGATIISAAKVEKLSEMQNFNLDDWVQTIGAKYKLPWTDEGRIIAQDLGQGVTIWDPEPRDPEFNFDVTAFRQDAFHDVQKQFQTLGPRSAAVYTMLNWFKQPIPTYKFVLTQPSFIPFTGQKIGLEVSFDEYTGVGVYLDKDGSRLGGGTGETIYGIITEVSHKPRSDVYEIDLWAINDILIDVPKEIAPTFDVALIPSPGVVDIVRAPVDYYSVDLLPFINILITAGAADVQRWDRRTGAIAWNGVDQYGTITGATTPNPGEIRLQFSSSPLALSVEEFLRLVPRTTAVGLAQNDIYAYMASENGVFTGGDVGDIYVL